MLKSNLNGSTQSGLISQSLLSMTSNAIFCLRIQIIATFQWLVFALISAVVLALAFLYPTQGFASQCIAFDKLSVATSAKALPKEGGVYILVSFTHNGKNYIEPLFAEHLTGHEFTLRLSLDHLQDITGDPDFFGPYTLVLGGEFETEKNGLIATLNETSGFLNGLIENKASEIVIQSIPILIRQISNDEKKQLIKMLMQKYPQLFVSPESFTFQLHTAKETEHLNPSKVISQSIRHNLPDLLQGLTRDPINDSTNDFARYLNHLEDAADLIAPISGLSSEDGSVRLIDLLPSQKEKNLAAEFRKWTNILLKGNYIKTQQQCTNCELSREELAQFLLDNSESVPIYAKDLNRHLKLTEILQSIRHYAVALNLSYNRYRIDSSTIFAPGISVAQ
jgi:hypothetical protein